MRDDELTIDHDRRAIASAVLLLGLAIATVGAIAVASLSGESETPPSAPAAGALPSALILPTIAPSSAAPPAVPSPSSTGVVAASTGLSLGFDLLPTGARVGDWKLSGDGDLEVVAVPTAVNRSARLDTRSGATACLWLDVALVTLSATFMLDAVLGGGQTLLTLDLDGETTLSVTLTDAGATIADSSEPVPLVPGIWYRWVVTHEADALGVRLFSADDALLAEAISPADGSRATEFCMAVEAPMRVYLDQLTVEAR